MRSTANTTGNHGPHLVENTRQVGASPSFMKANHMKKVSLLLFTMLFVPSAWNQLQAQWSPTSLEGVFVRTITVTNAILFAGTSGDGIFRSTNDGTSWTAVNSGLTNIYINAFVVSGTNLFV